jgi:hypothetical protein
MTVLRVSPRVFPKVAMRDKMVVLGRPFFSSKGVAMSRKENYGPGGFGDQYDNNKMRSMDRDQHIGGVTGTPFEDDMDLDKMDFNPRHGEAYYYPHKRLEPSRDADLGNGSSGTNWNRNLEQNFAGRGPKDWKLSDEKLKERVCEVLLHSNEVDATEIEVDVQDRIVNLKGNISSKGMRRVAEDLVGSIPGVEDVFTQLKIQNTSNFQLSDRAIKEARSTDLS